MAVRLAQSHPDDAELINELVRVVHDSSGADGAARDGSSAGQVEQRYELVLRARLGHPSHAVTEEGADRASAVLRGRGGP
jgi:hypothetical protein